MSIYITLLNTLLNDFYFEIHFILWDIKSLLISIIVSW